MRRVLPALSALLVLATAALPAAAQTEGTRVRVSPAWRVSDERWVVGILATSTADSLLIVRADNGAQLWLHRRDVNSLHVSTGVRPTAVTVSQYTAVATLAGLTAGALLGAALHSDEDTYWNRRGSATLGAALVGLPSAVFGGVVGWMVSGEQWADVPVAPVVAAGPRGSVGLALSLSL